MKLLIENISSIIPSAIVGKIIWQEGLFMYTAKSVSETEKAGDKS